MASSCVLIFAVIGHNTINIPEIFQVFTVFWSHYKSRGKGTRREVLPGGRQDRVVPGVATLDRSPDKSLQG